MVLLWCIDDSITYRFISDEKAEENILENYNRDGLLTNVRIEAINCYVRSEPELIRLFGKPICGGIHIYREKQIYHFILSADEFNGNYFVGGYCPQINAEKSIYINEIREFLSDIYSLEENKYEIDDNTLIYYKQPKISEINGETTTSDNAVYYILSSSLPEGKTDQIRQWIQVHEEAEQNDRYVITEYRCFDKNLFDYFVIWNIDNSISNISFSQYMRNLDKDKSIEVVQRDR